MTRVGPALERAVRRAVARFAARAEIDCDEVLLAVAECLEVRPQLAECTVGSLAAAAARAVRLDLDFSPVGGEAYLAPRGGKEKRAVLVPDYRGLLKLAYRNPRILYVDSEVVGVLDEFAVEWSGQWGPYIRHVPCLEPGRWKQNRPKAAYARAWWRGAAAPQIEIMTAEEIDAVAARVVPEGGDSPWRTDWRQMARKTVLKRLLKFIPIDPRSWAPWGPGRQPADGAEEDGEAGRGDVQRPGAGNPAAEQEYAGMIAAITDRKEISGLARAMRCDDRLDPSQRENLFRMLDRRRLELRAAGH